MSHAKVKAKARPKGAARAPAIRKKAAKSATLNAANGDWRDQTLARMRGLILAADPAMLEERKWVKPTKPLGVPVWSHDGIVCTGEIYAKVVKLTFAYGAKLPDPAGLFNASLEGATRRAIDIAEGAKVNERAFKALVKAAVSFNSSKRRT